ncbi:MAG TPA: hypothetical protein VNH11_13495 [Pirellulales bacterium]|nr:hypothetical protein [Pirellulales bacterium]
MGDLPKPIKSRMVELLARLADWPDVSGAKPLRGNLAGHYRLRTGDYRLQFRVEAQQLVWSASGIATDSMTRVKRDCVAAN